MPVQLRQITNTFCDSCDLLFSFEEMTSLPMTPKLECFFRAAFELGRHE